MKILISLLTMLAMQAPTAPKPTARNTIQGTITRAGTSDPVADAQITLNIGVPADRISAVAGGVSAMGVQAANFQSVVGQLMTMSAQDMQATINQFHAQGLPPALLAALDGMQAMMKSNPDLPRKATTDESGRFSIPDVPAGRYTLVIQRDGYFGTSPNGTAMLPQSVIAPIVVPEQQKPVEFSASMVAGGVVSGRVRDGKGRLAANANVQAFIVEYQNGLPVLFQAAAKQTDDRGEFRLAWLQPGAYILAATPRTPAAAAAAANAGPREIVVRSFYPSETESTKAVGVAVGSGADVGGIDIGLRHVFPVTVTGTVVSSLGSSLSPSATLMLVGKDPAIPETARTVGTVGLAASSGSFEVHDILPGSYDLFARIQDPQGTPGSAGLATFAWGRTSLEVRDRNVEGVTIVVHPSVDVRGTVTIDGKTPDKDASIRVGLQAGGTSSRIGNYQAVAGRQQTPAADGSFTVTAVAEGAYGFIVNGAPANAYVADVRQGAASIYDAGLYVTEKTPEPFEIVIRSDGGIVEGILTQADSQLVGRTLVVLIPNTRRQNAALYRTTLTNLEGRFTMRGVAPGAYKAFAWQNLPDGAYLNADFVKASEEQGGFLEVRAGQTISTAVRLIPNGK